MNRILLIEDDPVDRASLARLLRVAGYAVDAACHGADARERLRQRPAPRLILLDLKVPGMDGWEFLAERHRDRALATVPVVIFTGARGIDAPALRALGAEEVLRKPADPEALLAVVERYCPSASVPGYSSAPLGRRRTVPLYSSV